MKFFTVLLLSSTYRDEDAVRIFKLFRLVPNNLHQTLHVAHSDDADVVVEAEGLDEGEVDLEGDVTLKLLIHGQDAERHTVRVSVGTLKNKIHEILPTTE